MSKLTGTQAQVQAGIEDFNGIFQEQLRGIVGYFKNHTISEAIASVNGLLHLARPRTRGYRTFRNF